MSEQNTTDEELKVDNLFEFTYDPLKEALKLIAKQLTTNAKNMQSINERIDAIEETGKLEVPSAHKKPTSRISRMKIDKSPDGKQAPISEDLSIILKEQEDQLNEVKAEIENERKARIVLKKNITTQDKKMDKVVKALELTGLNVSEENIMEKSMELRPFTKESEEIIRRLEAEVKKLQLIVYSGKHQTKSNSNDSKTSDKEEKNDAIALGTIL